MGVSIARHRADVTVIGAGLTGACTALELAARGFSVALLDQDAAPMNRASRRNEGKIHLGLIYAADSSFGTAELQLRGALSFYSLLERWLGERVETLELSQPFTYLVARDSLFAPEQLAEHYDKLETSYRRHIAEHPQLTYLGTSPEYLARRTAPGRLDSRLSAPHIAAAFETTELAIDTDQLAELVSRAVLASDRIRFYPRHKVREIGRSNGGFIVSGEATDSAWNVSSEQVVNAAWENRLLLDSTLGLSPPPGWLYRLKFRVLAQLPATMYTAPSVTMVLGRYGDVVVRRNGTAYLSWYPAGLQGWSTELQAPAAWESACIGDMASESPDILRNIIDGISAWYPEIAGCRPYCLDAGAIVAHGKTDVDDPGSGLHDRTKVGVFSSDGYHSVDPGKLTTAPLFAASAASRVAASSQGSVARSDTEETCPLPEL